MGNRHSVACEALQPLLSAYNQGWLPDWFRQGRGRRSDGFISQQSVFSCREDRRGLCCRFPTPEST